MSEPLRRGDLRRAPVLDTHTTTTHTKRFNFHRPVQKYSIVFWRSWQYQLFHMVWYPVVEFWFSSLSVGQAR
jgi:hypothetical protein